MFDLLVGVHASVACSQNAKSFVMNVPKCELGITESFYYNLGVLSSQQKQQLQTAVAQAFDVAGRYSYFCILSHLYDLNQT